MPIILGRKPGGAGGSTAGVTSIGAVGDPSLSGVVTVSEGNGVELTQVGQDIAVSTVGIGARATRSGNFSHDSSGNWLSVTFDAETFDTSAFHDNSTNPSRMTIPAGLGGMYTVVGCIQWAGNATGQRDLSLLLNGTTSLAQVTLTPAAFAMGQEISLIYQLAAGDYLELQAYQNSEGTRTIVGDARTFFALAYLGS